MSLQELLVTPVKIKNKKLGHYIPKGKKEFVSECFESHFITKLKRYALNSI